MAMPEMPSYMYHHIIYHVTHRSRMVLIIKRRATSIAEVIDQRSESNDHSVMIPCMFQETVLHNEMHDTLGIKGHIWGWSLSLRSK